MLSVSVKGAGDCGGGWSNNDCKGWLETLSSMKNVVLVVGGGWGLLLR